MLLLSVSIQTVEYFLVIQGALMKRFVVLIIISLFSASALAIPPYLAKFKSTYASAKALHNCQICHGPEEKNDYAKDFAANGHNFKAIEGFDSDADGFSNIDEINAGTKPGDRDSRPAL